ncbi:replication-associated recombination protein A [Pseudofrankia inefficax]|uniref:AAA ATPase central domain protein n=1 Tax=Pseudofrankia inefficax (strain DSM 45817 / CECT 9037 / DDB 130130 / EuI1c) TaxID=298654 RepID=E3J8Y5_PSEI1|nr:replication-associated recombination protein A [Pseudofrankia inefficax]ADP79718.1 AAA ATPase central domain protein [Pseudofrankia inefficax]
MSLFDTVAPFPDASPGGVPGAGPTAPAGAGGGAPAGQAAGSRPAGQPGGPLPLPGPTGPLADRLRPRGLDELVGQRHLLGPGSPLRRLVEGGGTTSVVLWGPPGTGKTTLAHIVSRATGRRFRELSAVTAGVKDVRAVIDEARDALSSSRSNQSRRMVREPGLFSDAAQAPGGEVPVDLRTVLFIDEVHRFTRTQQDALLPAVERGWITLVAATTENPSFSVVAPLLSRSLLFTLTPLTDDDIRALVRRALVDPRGYGGRVRIADDALEHLVRLAGGDARRALTALEASAEAALAVAPTAVPTAAPTLATTPTPPAQAAGEGGSPGEAELGPAVAGAATDTAAPPATSPAVNPAPTDPTTDDPATADPTAADLVTTDPAVDGAAPESRAQAPTAAVDLALLEQSINRAAVRYDRDGDQHYDVVSAFIKSMRGGDADASLHYLARMIEAGEDPRFIARRMIILASEDIGMADPGALGVAVSAAQALELIGLPEARLALAQAVIHLALAPKSNAVIRAMDAATADVRAGKAGPVPRHLRDAHYQGARRLGHGDGYRYPHDYPEGVARQQYPPDELVGVDYYRPGDLGFERRAAARAAELRAVLRSPTPADAPRDPLDAARGEGS